jgi:hypothetical protein
MKDSMTVGPLLERLHEQMRQALDERLLPACTDQAGVWDRWAAVRAIETELRPILVAERDLVHAVSPLLVSTAAEHLWAMGELLLVLGSRLCELGRMGQGGQEFLRTAEKFRLAFDYWCCNVEAFIGPLPQGRAPDGLLARLTGFNTPAVAVA